MKKIAFTPIACRLWWVVVLACAGPQVVQQAPPDLRQEMPAHRPSAQAVWLPGEWTYEKGGAPWVWLPGRWAQPQPGMQFEPGYWVRTGKGWVQHPGIWVQVPTE